MNAKHPTTFPIAAGRIAAVPVAAAPMPFSAQSEIDSVELITALIDAVKLAQHHTRIRAELPLPTAALAQ